MGATGGLEILEGREGGIGLEGGGGPREGAGGGARFERVEEGLGGGGGILAEGST